MTNGKKWQLMDYAIFGKFKFSNGNIQNEKVEKKYANFKNINCKKIRLIDETYFEIDQAIVELNNNKKMGFDKVIFIDEETYEFQWNIHKIKKENGMLTIGCKTYPFGVWARWYKSGLINSFSTKFGGKDFWNNYGDFLKEFFREQVEQYYIYD